MTLAIDSELQEGRPGALALPDDGHGAAVDTSRGYSTYCAPLVGREGPGVRAALCAAGASASPWMFGAPVGLPPVNGSRDYPPRPG